MISPLRASTSTEGTARILVRPGARYALSAEFRGTWAPGRTVTAPEDRAERVGTLRVESR